MSQGGQRKSGRKDASELNAPTRERGRKPSRKQKVELSNDYEEAHPRFERCRDEVLFLLNEFLKRDGIKTHSVTGRVKTLESFLEKAERNEYGDPIEEMRDLTGTKVVCLSYPTSREFGT